MAGTKAGGIAAAETNKRKYGEDFYQKIAQAHWADPVAKANHKPGGFYTNRELARKAGRKGGRISRRKKNAN